MGTWAASLVSVTLVSLASLVGALGFLVPGRARTQAPQALVAFAVGGLLGDAFIHLLPEAFAAGTPALAASLPVLGGMLLFFLVEKLLRRDAHRHGRHLPPVAIINLLGDAVHNFIDGMVIGSSFLVSTRLGLSTTLAVLLHELPQELGDIGVLVGNGLGLRKALLANLASAAVAILGTLAALALGGLAHGLVHPLVPFTAGGFIYLAAADLVPELQRERGTAASLVQVAAIVTGIGVMALLTMIE